MTHSFPYKCSFSQCHLMNMTLRASAGPGGTRTLSVPGLSPGSGTHLALVGSRTWALHYLTQTFPHLAAIPHSNLSWHHLIKLQMWAPATWFLISFRVCEVLAGGEIGVDAESQRARGVGTEHPCTSYTQQLPQDVHSQQVENGALKPMNPGSMPTSAAG